MQKATTKRSRPKPKNEEDGESSEEFVKKKAPRKNSKVANIGRKAAQKQKKKSKRTTLKSKTQLQESSDVESEVSSQKKEENVVKMIAVPLQAFKPDKLFAQILNRANKQPDFLIMLRNLLSGCSRLLRDKKNFLKKKWQMLRMSNCTQDEYLSRQTQLKKMQLQQVYQMQKDIMSKLSFANVRGFEQKQALIDSFKQKAIVDEVNEQFETEYYIDTPVWQKYHEEQKKLLSLLMNEKDLVSSTSIDVKNANSHFAPNRQHKTHNEDNQIDIKFSNIETEVNPQTTEFLFCKHFSQINYDKVFEGNNPFKLNQTDTYYMDSKALSWILESKSDEVYTNQKFQKQTYKRYTDMLAKIYINASEVSDEQLIEQLLQITAYILNSVHYYQKFKLKCELLHPLDLFLVIQKIKKQRKRKENIQLKAKPENQIQPIEFDKEIQKIAASLSQI